MKSKKQNNKVCDCLDCLLFDGKNCNHETNKGIRIVYKEEFENYIKTPKQLNKKGECENFRLRELAPF